MKKICLIGGINYASIVDSDSFKNENSVPSNIHSRFGGVAYNIAIKLSEYKDGEITLISVLSNDVLGNLVSNFLSELGIKYQNSIFVDNWSSYYCHINTKDGSYGFDDMRCLKKVTPEYIKSIKNVLDDSDIIFIDGNLNEDTISYIANNVKTPLFFDGTSPEKAIRVKNCFDKIDFVKFNYYEYCRFFNIDPKDEILPEEIIHHLLDEKIKNKLVVSLGKQGALLFSNSGYSFYKPENIIESKNALRAGDSFVSGIICGYLNNLTDYEILVEGTKRSVNVLKQNIKESNYT